MTRAARTFLATMAVGAALAAVAQALDLSAGAGVVLGIAYMLAIALILNSRDDGPSDGDADCFGCADEGACIHETYVTNRRPRNHG